MSSAGWHEASSRNVRRTAAELGRHLAERWPGRDTLSLSAAVGHLVPLVQVPPRGVWGTGGLPTWGLAETWLGAAVGIDPAPDDLVLRYLGAFGPASVADIGNWSGLTRLGAVVERLRRSPRRLSRRAGSRALRPARCSAAWSGRSRTRPVPARVRQPPARPQGPDPGDGRRPATPLFPGNGAALGSVLLDGRFAGGWRIERAGQETILADRGPAPAEPSRRRSGGRELRRRGRRSLQRGRHRRKARRSPRSPGRRDRHAARDPGAACRSGHGVRRCAA